MTEAIPVFTINPLHDWVLIRKVDNPVEQKPLIYKVNRDPNGPEYGVVLKVGPDVTSVQPNEMVLLGAGVGDMWTFQDETLYWLQESRRDIKAVLRGG